MKDADRNTEEFDIRLIAFYLPQYHPIPENDRWWGKGFTEWSNVVQARPLFRGHYQPKLPADLGFYDLRLPEARIAQAELAQEYGIHGFCYYHYWFNEKQLLERPFNEVLNSGQPDFPFCLCWANENWTRSWDGLETDVLIAQNHGIEDDLAHIRWFLRAFDDHRYIRVEDRPLLLVYRAGLLSEPRVTAELWREEAKRAGIGDLYLASIDSIGQRVTPEDTGFDATVEFAPDWYQVGNPINPGIIERIRRKLPGGKGRQFNIFSYDTLVENMLAKPEPNQTQFRCVTPSWDKTARRGEKADLWVGSTPEKYQAWLSSIIRQTRDRLPSSQRLVFINAWNEWAEGCYLEPDQESGRAYLEATRRALEES